MSCESGATSLRRAVNDFTAPITESKAIKVFATRVIEPVPTGRRSRARVQRRVRLGRMLSYYHRDAA